MKTSLSTRIAAVAIVLGPLLFTVADLIRRLVEPAGTPSAGQLTQAVGRQSGAWSAAASMSVIAAFCFVFGMAGLPGIVTGRGARLTAIGAGLTTIGAIAAVGHAVAYYTPYALYHDAGTSLPALTALDRASAGYPMLVLLIALFIVGLMLGSILLLIGLRRARRVPLWSVLAAVLFVVCGSTGGVVAGVLGILAALAAFAPVARAIARPVEGRTSSRPASRAASLPEGAIRP